MPRNSRLRFELRGSPSFVSRSPCQGNSDLIFHTSECSQLVKKRSLSVTTSMRFFSSNLLQWLMLMGCASARDAYLINYDIQPPSTPSSSHPIVDSRTGNSILARRLGLTESKKLGLVDDGVLSQLNEHGGHSTSLFGSAFSLFGARNGPLSPDRLLLVVEGYDGTAPNVVEGLPAITIQRPDINLGSSSYLLNWIPQKKDGSSTCKGYKSLDSGVHVSFVMGKKVWTYGLSPQDSR